MSSTPWAGRRLHFIGIGGAGMCGLALVAQALGAEVTGSDRAESSYSERLRDAGIEPVIGHDAANVPDGAEIVVSTAIADDNPELAAARERGRAGAPPRRPARRGDAACGADRRGRHAREDDDPASMAAHVLVETGRDPAYLIGGEVRVDRHERRLGGGGVARRRGRRVRPLVPQARRPRSRWSRTSSSTTTRRSRRIGELEEAFDRFTRAAAPGRHRRRWRSRTSRARRRSDRASAPCGAEFELLGARPSQRAERARGRARLPRGGRRAGGGGRGAALASPGAGRRFEPHGTRPAGSAVYDDYAHHPTEVRATLEAARTLGAERVVACFQPHLYSRTQHLARDFGKALALADVAVVLDVYPARERAEDFPGRQRLARRGGDRGRSGRAARLLGAGPGRRRAPAAGRSCGEGDALLTLGAGDVDELARSLATAAG